MNIIKVQGIFAIQNENGSFVGFYKTLEIAEKRMKKETENKK